MRTRGGAVGVRRVALVVAGLCAGVVPAVQVHPAGVAAASSATMVLADNGATLGTVNRTLFGADTAPGYGFRQQNGRALWPSVASVSQSLGLSFFRMGPDVNFTYCPNTDCTYHWTQQTPGVASGTTAGTPPSGTKLSPDEFVAEVSQVSASPTVMPVLNMEAGTLSEAQDWVAYMNGSTTDKTVLQDLTTVGHWASIRAANGHAQPYGIRYWEVGNEEWDAHICIPPASTTAAGCVDHFPTPDATDTFCTMADLDTMVSSANASAVYACVVKYYARAVHAVDSFATVVANYIGQDFGTLHTVAGSAVGTIDVHDYQDPVDPYGTTFTLDNQSQTYTLPTAAPGGTVVTVGLWVTSGSGDGGHLDVTFNGVPVVLSSSSVPANSAWSVTPPVLTFVEPEAAFNATPTIAVTACDAASVGLTKLCAAKGRDPQIDLHRITVSSGQTDAATLEANSACFQDMFGMTDNGHNVPTQVADTHVNATQQGTAAVPWRLSQEEDLPVAYATGQQSMLTYALNAWRQTFTTAGYGSTPLIIGEYAGWGGCSQHPVDFNLTQSSAMWLAEQTATMASDHNTAQPIVGAGYFSLFGNQGAYCDGFTMVSAVRASPTSCAGTNNGYLLPTGWAMSQFSGLTGAYIGTTVSGGPTVTAYPVSVQGQTAAGAIVAVASIDTSVTPSRFSVVILNRCPPVTTQQCGGSGPITATLSLGSGGTFGSASATTVTASDALADNSDTAPNNVSSATLATTLSGGTVTLTLPAFSITTVTLTR